MFSTIVGIDINEGGRLRSGYVSEGVGVAVLVDECFKRCRG